MRLSEVADYVNKKYDKEISRQTIYSWVHKGIRGIFLKVVKIPRKNHLGKRITMTTPEYVDAFVTEVENFFKD